MAVVSDGSKRFQVDFIASGAAVGEELFDQWGEVLEAAGWTPVEWSDGSSITVSATRATTVQMANTNAWQRMIAPAGLFEINWQRSTTDNSWRGFFSQVGFTIAGTGANLPSAVVTELVQYIGNSGSFDTQWAPATTNLNRFQMCADSVPGQTDIYYFHWLSNIVSSGNESDRFLFSPLETGTYPIENTAPWLLVPGDGTATLNGNTNLRIHYKQGLAGDAIVTSGPVTVPEAQFPSLGLVNQYNTKHLFKRAGSRDPAGPDEHTIGKAIDLYYPETPKGLLPERATVNLATAWGAIAGGDPGAVIRFDECLVPWPSTVVPA